MIGDNFEAALRDLVGREVKFILVGGLASILNGAPVNTLDLDLVYSRDPENLDRILAFFESSDTIFRIQPHRRFRPDITHLSGRGHLNLTGKYGLVDFLATIGDGLDYDALLPNSHPVEIDADLVVQVLNLETIIALKEELGGDKDQAMLPTLRAALREKQKKDNPSL